MITIIIILQLRGQFAFMFKLEKHIAWWNLREVIGGHCAIAFPAVIFSAWIIILNIVIFVLRFKAVILRVILHKIWINLLVTTIMFIIIDLVYEFVLITYYILGIYFTRKLRIKYQFVINRLIIKIWISVCWLSVVVCVCILMCTFGNGIDIIIVMWMVVGIKYVYIRWCCVWIGCVKLGNWVHHNLGVAYMAAQTYYLIEPLRGVGCCCNPRMTRHVGLGWHYLMPIHTVSNCVLRHNWPLNHRISSLIINHGRNTLLMW